MLENDIVHVHVPANLNHKFQPLGINVNGVAKGFLRGKFQTWYADEIQKQMDNGKNVYEVDSLVTNEAHTCTLGNWPL